VHCTLHCTLHCTALCTALQCTALHSPGEPGCPPPHGIPDTPQPAVCNWRLVRTVHHPLVRTVHRPLVRTVHHPLDSRRRVGCKETGKCCRGGF
jgi:hypothetical protein